MEIICVEKHEKVYRPLFGAPVLMCVATVHITIPGEGTTVMTFSERNDDPEDTWFADSRIGPNGFPYFIHGEGERSCSKQVAGPPIVEAIYDYPFICIDR
jgi:hypothetical protein